MIDFERKLIIFEGRKSTSYKHIKTLDSLVVITEHKSLIIDKPFLYLLCSSFLQRVAEISNPKLSSKLLVT